LRETLLDKEGVSNVTPDLSDPAVRDGGQDAWLNDDEHVAKLSLIFDGNPYDIETMGYLNSLRENNSEKLIEATNLTSASIYFDGESAKQENTMKIYYHYTDVNFIFI